MPSKLDAFNQALGLTGGRNKLTATSDNTRGAEQCNQWWDSAVEVVMNATTWPELRRTQSLALIAERTLGQDWTDQLPLPGWRYAYTPPANYIKLTRLITDSNYCPAQGFQYALGTIVVQDDGPPITTEVVSALFCNVSPAIMQYSVNESDTNAWSRELFDSIVYELAARIAPGLSNSDNTIRLRRLEADAMLEKHEVRRANEEPTMHNTERSEFELARGDVPWEPFASPFHVRN